MTREEAVSFFSELYCGKHHIPAPGCFGEHGVREFGHGWYVCHYTDMATWDHNMLTRAVFLAHDRCYRLEISPAGRYTRIAIHPRKRGGSIMTDHPTLEEAVTMWRKHYPKEEETK